jgi:hypothetical protein
MAESCVTEIATAMAVALVVGWLSGLWVGGSSRRRAERLIRARNATVTFTPGPVTCSNRGDAPATPKPRIIPKPQFPAPRRIREDFL